MATYEQPGRTEVQDKSGKKTLTITYVGDTIATAPTISGASLYSKTVVTAEAGTVRSTFQYDLTEAGSVTSSGGNIVGIEFVGSLRTVPMQAHPYYDEMTAGEQKAVADWVQNPAAGSKEVPDEWSSYLNTGLMTNLAIKLLKGKTSYYEPSVILRKTYFSSSLPSGSKLGKIKDPNIYYAAKPDNSDWLLVSLSARGQSGAYSVTEEYELSGENGWDADLYTP